MATVVITTQGTLIEKRGDHLRTVTPEGLRRDIPLVGMDRLWIYGKCQVSTPAIHLLAEQGKELAYFSRRGRLRARLVINPAHGVEVRRTQYRWADDPTTTQHVANTMISGKILNQRSVVMRASRSGGGPSTEELSAQNGASEQAMGCTDLDTLRGIEGSAARRHYAQWATFMSEEYPWPGRKRRPPTDPLNVMLSFLGSVLAADLQAHCQAIGLDPWCGFIHGVRAGAPALALDLMEPFRPLVIDRLILDLVRHHRIRPEHFTNESTGNAWRSTDVHQDRDEDAGTGALRLTEDGLKVLLTAYERRMHDPDEEDGSTRGMRARIRLSVENIAKAMRVNDPDLIDVEVLRT